MRKAKTMCFLVLSAIVFILGGCSPAPDAGAKVATPVISPESGSVVPGTLVAIKTTTEGATIYYTTDGETPTVDSEEYTAPFEVVEAVTVKAIAEKDGEVSGVATAEYTIPTTYVSVKSPVPAEDYSFPIEDVTLEYVGEGRPVIKYGFDADESKYETYNGSFSITEDKLDENGSVTLYTVATVDGEKTASNTFTFQQKASSIKAEISLIGNTSTAGVFTITSDKTGDGLQYRVDNGAWTDYSNYATAAISKGKTITIQVREKGCMPVAEKKVAYGLTDPMDLSNVTLPVSSSAQSFNSDAAAAFAKGILVYLGSGTQEGNSGISPLIMEGLVALLGEKGTALDGLVSYTIPDGDYNKMRMEFLKDITGKELGIPGITIVIMKGSSLDVGTGKMVIKFAPGETSEEYYVLTADNEGVSVVDKNGDAVTDENIQASIPVLSSLLVSATFQAVLMESLTKSLGEVIPVENGRVCFSEYGINGNGEFTMNLSASLDNYPVAFYGYNGTVSSDGLAIGLLMTSSTSTSDMTITVDGACLIDGKGVIYSDVAIKPNDKGADASGTFWFDGKPYDVSTVVNFLG